jgi:hypothetical protein
MRLIMTAYDEENFVSNSSITLETPEVEKLRPRISLSRSWRRRR